MRQTPYLVKKKVDSFFGLIIEEKAEFEWQIKAPLVKKNGFLISGESPVI